MRHYIRHPLDISIHYKLGDTLQNSSKDMKNISEGGLCFHSSQYIAKGTLIHIEIPIDDPPFEVDGIVVWCCEHDGYDVGVQFSDESKAFGLRMVEQACHIKHYKDEILKKENRVLSSDEAAREWILKYAQAFPR